VFILKLLELLAKAIDRFAQLGVALLLGGDLRGGVRLRGFKRGVSGLARGEKRLHAGFLSLAARRIDVAAGGGRELLDETIEQLRVVRVRERLLQRRNPRVDTRAERLQLGFRRRSGVMRDGVEQGLCLAARVSVKLHAVCFFIV
jgi:hypothetical protein